MTDLDAWIDGAQRTHRSVVIYQSADLIAQADDLHRQIQVAKFDGHPTDGLEAQFEAIAEQYTASGLKITVQGLTQAEFEAIRAKAALDNVSTDVCGARILARAIIDPIFTEEQLLRLGDKIGDAQIGRINAAMVLASQHQPPELTTKADRSGGLLSDPSIPAHPSSGAEADQPDPDTNPAE